MGSYIIPKDRCTKSASVSHVIRTERRTTRIIQPSCWCREVVSRAPSCEEGVVAHALNDIGSQYCGQLLRTNSGEASERHAQKRERSKHLVRRWLLSVLQMVSSVTSRDKDVFIVRGASSLNQDRQHRYKDKKYSERRKGLPEQWVR